MIRRGKLTVYMEKAIDGKVSLLRKERFPLERNLQRIRLRLESLLFFLGVGGFARET